MSKEQYLRECEQDNQKVLKQIWDKLEFPMNSAEPFSLSFRLPRKFVSQTRENDQTITKQAENFVIRPQDGHAVAYHVSYLNDLLERLKTITNVSIQWTDGKTDRVVVHWNESTGKVQLRRF